MFFTAVKVTATITQQPLAAGRSIPAKSIRQTIQSEIWVIYGGHSALGATSPRFRKDLCTGEPIATLKGRLADVRYDFMIKRNYIMILWSSN